MMKAEIMKKWFEYEKHRSEIDPTNKANIEYTLNEAQKMNWISWL